MNKIVLPIRQEGWNLVGADDVLLLGGIWGDEEGKAEAEKIVIAVNAHDALVAALEWYVKNDDTNLTEEGNEFWIDGHARGTEALKLAKGG